jgi:nicotinate-nucleotide pyrophosphorylase (carboxylating)
MNKNQLVLKLFQKDHLLKMTNPPYKKIVDSLFNWLINCDHTDDDQTSKLVSNKTVEATIRSHQDIIIAGIEEIECFLKKYPKISFQKKVTDGKKIKAGDEIAILSGDSKLLLSLERTILNVLQRMSGIATQTNKFAKILDPVYIAATRKTPWMLLDKKAVAVGGGLTHRLDLSDGILIKDNHLQILKNEYKLINEEQAVIQALKIIAPTLLNTTIEIEVNTKEGANAALQAFSKMSSRNYGIIMLDNWKTKEVKNFIKETQKKPEYDSILLEASGNINENNLQDWAKSYADVISSGALTHSTKAADISLEIK